MNPQRNDRIRNPIQQDLSGFPKLSADARSFNDLHYYYFQYIVQNRYLVEKMKKEGVLAYLQNYRISIGVESVIFCDLYFGCHN